jgi:hypothetical protein
LVEVLIKISENEEKRLKYNKFYPNQNTKINKGNKA